LVCELCNYMVSLTRYHHVLPFVRNNHENKIEIGVYRMMPGAG
jgi:hypothetical protein